MKETSFTVSRREDQRTLLDLLSVRLDLSRKRAKGLLDARTVYVNKQRTWMARHTLRAGDQVVVHFPEPPARAGKVKVIYEDDQYLVVDKPAGVLSVGHDSVETRLRASRKQPGLRAVHRLDRDTSGCFLLAFSEKDKQEMVQLFRARKVSKVYHAIVYGRLARKLDRSDLPVQGRWAATAVKVLDSRREATHIQARIETGRTHQIRKHMAAMGHPVIGDKAYATGALPEEAFRQVRRQLLHAAGISFQHPGTQKMLHAKAELPADFRYWLRKLKLT